MCAFGDERLPDRFWAKVETCPETGCWLWVGANVPAGYGRINWPTRKDSTYSHRVAYSELVGPIPTGLQIDHLCRNRACCNPAHLEAVTPRENILRGDGPEVQRTRHAQTTHCPKGHPYSGSNLRTYVTRGGHRNRVCRTCTNERQATPEHKAYMRAYRARAAAQARDAA